MDAVSRPLIDLVIADYLPPARHVDDTLGEMARLRDDDVLDARMALTSMHLGDVDLDDDISPRGLRLLRRVSSLPADVAARIVNDFGDLARLQRATVDDLMDVDGVDAAIAGTVRDTLQRVAENTILDQYH